MSKPALLVIDVQSAMASGQWAAYEVDHVIDRINALANNARTLGVPVIFVQHEEPEGPMRHDSDGWKLAPRLEVDTGDFRVRKTTPDSFEKTELQAMLGRLGVDRLVVCGMQSEYCVDSTVRRALALGYPVTLVSDAHTTLDNGVIPAATITAHHNATLAGMESFGVRAKAVAAADVSFA